MAFWLVTGGCGFIGSHLVDALLARGDKVRVLDDLSTGRRSNLPRGVEVMVGDVADAQAVAQRDGAAWTAASIWRRWPRSSAATRTGWAPTGST